MLPTCDCRGTHIEENPTNIVSMSANYALSVKFRTLNGSYRSIRQT